MQDRDAFTNESTSTIPHAAAGSSDDAYWDAIAAIEERATYMLNRPNAESEEWLRCELEDYAGELSFISASWPDLWRELPGRLLKPAQRHVKDPQRAKLFLLRAFRPAEYRAWREKRAHQKRREEAGRDPAPKK